MLTFNNTHIFTGYLKQLLADFNLPKYHIYTKAQQEYVDQYKKEKNVLQTITTGNNIRIATYIKDDQLAEYVNGQWVQAGRTTSGQNRTQFYHYNIPELNQTKNLVITGNDYDRATHEYLGDYLRFKRDYLNINLMPLYNCFSNYQLSNYKISFTTSINGETKTISFDTTDKQYNIFAIPVRLFQEYTIALDSSLPIELCCTIYNGTQQEVNDFKLLQKATYQYIRQSRFNSPFIYDKLTNIFEAIDETGSLGAAIVSRETDLKILLKLPKNNTSTLTVLEGNYLNYMDRLYIPPNTEKNATNQPIVKANHYITNFAEKAAINVFKPIGNLQLLQLNTGTSYPFADRLIEYLSGNVITSEEDIKDNVLRIQQVLSENNNYSSIPGAFEEKYRPIFYDYIQKYHKTSDINHDILGYADKDVSANYTSWQALSKEITTSAGIKQIKKYYKPINTIDGVDIYTDLYNNQYK